MVEKKVKLIGKYELLEKIGEGGFGIVYKANDTSLDRLVAIKQLKIELSSTLEYLERFRRESRLMGSLNHPNIVKMLEVFEDAGRYFIVMDFMPNGSLEEKLKLKKPLSVHATLEVLKPIAKALDYAHRKNLIHRDIKPSNILFTEGDDPVLSDFSLVKSLESKSMTTTGMVFGTPEYMAPEQILGKDLTPAVDLYAFGVVAYQMLTGEIPFIGSTPFEIQEGHVHKALPDIVEKNNALPKGYSEIFTRMMAKNPNERYESALEFYKQLEDVSNQHLNTQIEEELRVVNVSIHEKDFSLAIRTLETLIRIKSSPELTDLLNECQRREQIWNEVQQLHIERDNIEKRINELSHQEKWIFEKNDISEFPDLAKKGINKEDSAKVQNEDNKIVNNVTEPGNERPQSSKWLLFWFLTLLIFLIVVVVELNHYSGDAIAIGVFVEAILTVIIVSVKKYDY